jgi:agmatinase
VKGPQARKQFLDSKNTFEESRVILVGCPFDESVSFRSGAAKGPTAIRTFSDVLETYSPELDADLEDVAFFDGGDLSLPEGQVHAALDLIRKESARILSAGKIPFGLGGDHLISLPLVEASLEAHPDLVVFQWDAHADLRDEYEKARLSHATVMRRVLEKIGEERLVQFGIRSGTREEWRWIRGHGTYRPLTPESVEAELARLSGKVVYLTLDLDVLDPSELPGTGTPEPGGMQFGELSKCIGVLRRLKVPIVGLDVVELAPLIDPSGASAVAAAKAVRELLLALPQ